MRQIFLRLKKFISQLGLYGLFFSLILISFGFMNAKKVLNFWINNETDYNEWTIHMASKGETDYISNFWGKMQFVNLNGLMRNITGQHEMNYVFKLNNGYLFTPYAYEKEEDLQYKADQLNTFHNYLDSLGIPMLYAMCPYTSSKYDPELPEGVSDYGNDNLDRFMEMVNAYGIETIDFRDEMYADGIDQYKMMYKTDHHWTTEAGFYAYQKLMDWILKKTNAEVDERVMDISNYEKTTYPKWHLGSRGQRTGIYYAGIDDFVLFTPMFETSFTSEDVTGSFTDLIINYEPLQNKEYTSRYTYDYVLGNALHNYVNNYALNDVKVLFITDSFGKCVNPYLISSFKEVRYQYDGDTSLLDRPFMEYYKPDVVILLYYSDFVCGDDRAFSFGTN